MILSDGSKMVFYSSRGRGFCADRFEIISPRFGEDREVLSFDSMSCHVAPDLKRQAPYNPDDPNDLPFL